MKKPADISKFDDQPVYYSGDIAQTMAIEDDSFTKEMTVPKNQAMTDNDKKIHDLIIVGAGPAALTASIYTSRDDIETLIFEKALVGGIPATTDWIDNYPGFPQGVSGLDFAESLRLQAERFGTRIEFAEVIGLKRKAGSVVVSTNEGDYYAKAVLVATGSDNKKLNIPGEDKYYANGVHYCATCDGAFYRDKSIVVIGGGNSAVQEALFLTRFAKHVDLLARSTLRASDILVHKLGQNDKIKVHLHSVPEEIVGNTKVEKVLARDVNTGQQKEFKTDGVFVFIGQIPNTSFLKETGMEFDEAGFILTDDKLQTTIKGVFAAGDNRSGATMQIASAVGEGATAALSIREYLHHSPAIDYQNIES